MTRLDSLTTIRLGGPARRLVAVSDEREAAAAVRAAERDADPLLVLAGGSNVVVADAGFPGTVVHVVSRGVEFRDGGELEVAAGEPWDAVVAGCVERGLAGVECLSGIPGSSGATPIQNVGAYGQDVSQTIVAVRAYDRRRDETVVLSPGDCAFTYRSSAFKRDRERWLVLSVGFRLHRGRESMPIAYPELARELGVAVGARAPLAAVREAVLRVRSRKGMVIDPNDPDSVSVGSFFTNPILTPAAFAALAARARERVGAEPPRFPEPDGRVKTSAAWLVERAGFERGRRRGNVGISAKHTLALVNRGGGTAAELVALAREIVAGVEVAFGVTLVPEPVLVGVGEELSNPRNCATRPVAPR